jgi:Flp pilus assembly protein TadD
MARRVDEALHTFEGLLAKGGDPPARLLEEAAVTYALASEPTKAEESFRKALEKDPSLARSHRGLGLLLQSQGRLPEAEAELRRALALEPEVPSARKALADLLLQKGDAAAAAALLDSGVKAHPRDSTLRLALARALDSLGRAEEAEAQRRAARELASERKP